MGLIFAKLWSLFGSQEHKVIIVGLDNAGKTTILYQFLMNEVVHTSPTIGSNVEEIVVKNTHFLMWDIGGQESLRSSWNTYYSNTEFIILVVDSIDRERLSITKEELHRMLAHEDLRKAAVLIFANKQDMKGCMTAAEISTYLTLSSIKDHPWHIQSCCALTGEGLCQGLEWMTSRIGQFQKSSQRIKGFEDDLKGEWPEYQKEISCRVVKSFSIPKPVILSSYLNTLHTVMGR
ncbi:ADP-ribosylation factor-like protein 5B isoform X2 [Tyto alba]|uniref:ADP-ribosylation factor-like protein 5B isoform X2 n=1 Tax=Tyto alba TaxID=56313 RepID=UPI001C684D33|nr:ADP-ribosylation factor-like protein 5B isoform X2 [Tyto alba]